MGGTPNMTTIDGARESTAPAASTEPQDGIEGWIRDIRSDLSDDPDSWLQGTPAPDEEHENEQKPLVEHQPTVEAFGPFDGTDSFATTQPDPLTATGSFPTAAPTGSFPTLAAPEPDSPCSPADVPYSTGSYPSVPTGGYPTLPPDVDLLAPVQPTEPTDVMPATEPAPSTPPTGSFATIESFSTVVPDQTTESYPATSYPATGSFATIEPAPTTGAYPAIPALSTPSGEIPLPRTTGTPTPQHTAAEWFSTPPEWSTTPPEWPAAATDWPSTPPPAPEWPSTPPEWPSTPSEWPNTPSELPVAAQEPAPASGRHRAG